MEGKYMKVSFIMKNKKKKKSLLMMNKMKEFQMYRMVKFNKDFIKAKKYKKIS